MYDPTVFENLKVAFENQVYDLDNLDRKINIQNRVDQIDLSILTRRFAIQFILVNQQAVTAEIILKASLEDLAGEILEILGGNAGCSLILRFNKRVQNVPVQCEKVEQALNDIWENEIQIRQTLSFVYNKEDSSYLNKIEVEFVQKINEEHMEDIADFLEHVLETLEVLNGI